MSMRIEHLLPMDPAPITAHYFALNYSLADDVAFILLSSHSLARQQLVGTIIGFDYLAQRKYDPLFIMYVQCAEALFMRGCAHSM